MNDRDITFLEKIQLYKKLKSYLTKKFASNEKSNEELKDLWRKILPILEHNQTRLLEFGKGKTKK